MMKVDIGQEKYVVKWKHYDNGTTCFIKNIDGYMGDIGLIQESRSIMNPKDKFNKQVGRKVSLSKALSALSFSRDKKRKFWQQYDKEIGLSK